MKKGILENYNKKKDYFDKINKESQVKSLSIKKGKKIKKKKLAINYFELKEMDKRFEFLIGE